MLMATKKLEYLLERVTKYYMALNTGFANETNKEQLNRAMIQIEENLVKFSMYDYPEEMKITQKKLDSSWTSNRVLFHKSGSLFIPKLMFISVSNLESTLSQLALYHSKNQ